MIIKYYNKNDQETFNFNLLLSNEIGLHCGTLAQAKNRPGKHLYELLVDTSNVCDLTFALDIHWSGISFIRELLGAGIINKDKHDEYVRKFRANSPQSVDDEVQKKYKSKFCREILQELGYTGFTYTNNVEGTGTSICIIDENIIHDVKPITEDYSSISDEFKLYENLWD